MKKKHLQLIIILTLCVIFGAGYLWMSGAENQDASETITTEDTEEIRLISEMTVEEISYESAENEAAGVAFALRDGDVWYAKDAPEFSINSEEVATMVHYLCNMDVTRTIDVIDVTELSDYGFDEPTYKIMTVQSGGSESTFLFGNYNDIAGGYYLMEEGGNEICVVNTILTTYLERTLEHWGVAEATETDAEE
ncbi:MAG: DUF4340 domain-containing protein [Lachnospiraceae bacterium]|nr:DUF4340 domain-containing protein [Lachnospiraceae bacterium]